MNIFQAIGKTLSSATSAICTLAEGVDEYAKIVKTSGQYCNAELDNLIAQAKVQQDKDLAVLQKASK